MIKFYYNLKNKLGLYEAIKSLDPSKLWRIRFDVFDEKSRLQEEKYHAMLSDIADQAKHLNRTFDADAWKRLCVAQFREDCIEQNLDRLSGYWISKKMELVPSLGGTTLVVLGAQTRDFPKYVAAGFIEWLYAYGESNEINWTEPQHFDERQYA